LKFELDTFNNDFVISTTRIASGFVSPVDAELVENVMYVIENGYPGSPHIPVIWKLTFPLNTTGIKDIVKNERTIYPVPSNGIVYIKGGSPGDVVVVSDLSGKSIRSMVSQNENQKLDLQHLDDGCYIVRIFNDKVPVYLGKIIIAKY